MAKIKIHLLTLVCWPPTKSEMYSFIIKLCLFTHTLKTVFVGLLSRKLFIAPWMNLPYLIKNDVCRIISNMWKICWYTTGPADCCDPSHDTAVTTHSLHFWTITNCDWLTAVFGMRILLEDALLSSWVLMPKHSGGVTCLSAKLETKMLFLARKREVASQEPANV